MKMESIRLIIARMFAKEMSDELPAEEYYSYQEAPYVSMQNEINK